MADVSNGETAPKPKYQRIVLKLSGEALGDRDHGDAISGDILQRIATEVKKVHDLGVQIGIVVGGGNIFRGKLGAQSTQQVDRTTGDFMGMLATMINGLALMDCLEKNGVPVRVQSALHIDEVAEPFILRRAIRHLEKGRVVIFVAGTGNPYFSTDTTASLRASEIGADIIMKATKVDGVYDCDPKLNPEAQRYEHLTFSHVLTHDLRVMDGTAIALCRENNIPIVVFDLSVPGNIMRAIQGDTVGTIVGGQA